jgi:OmpR family response regulator RpaB|tara:strand:+ start:2348 stop:3043 length:696 start_codon:yes stop_codon:yes gene_type:complete
MNQLETVLIADGDLTSRLILTQKLSNHGYRVITASDGEEALFLFNKEQPHIVLIDVILPKIDGYKVCSKLRNDSSTPIVLLTSLDKLNDRVIGLSLGADDYLIKPFSTEELKIRIRSILQRSYNNNSYPLFIQIGDLKLNVAKRCVLKKGQPIKLTKIEFKLLEVLLARSGEGLTRLDIFNKVWGYTTFRYLDTRVVDVYIYRLRSKLEKKPSIPTLILTVRGKGYMFQEI